ncbi:hypothetical protein TNCV_4534231 [Trichonephila clavipes]|nr:hypothetical protein TNCV_4534231 [Trichonephila clavipes]
MDYLLMSDYEAAQCHIFLNPGLEPKMIPEHLTLHTPTKPQWPWVYCPELVVGVSGVRSLVPLKTHRVEGPEHAKSIEVQSFPMM